MDSSRTAQLVAGLHGVSLGLSLLHRGSVSAQLLSSYDIRLAIAVGVLFMGAAQAWYATRPEAAPSRRLTICAGSSAVWAMFFAILLSTGTFTPALYQGAVTLGVNVWLCWHLAKRHP